MLGVGSLTANADEAAEDTKILLVLDASGSMKGDDPSGTTKLKAAKKALTTAISALPDDAQVGLVDGDGRWRVAPDKLMPGLFRCSHPESDKVAGQQRTDAGDAAQGDARLLNPEFGIFDN